MESKCPVWDGIPGNTGRKQWEVRQEGRKPIEGAFSSTLSPWANEDEFHWELGEPEQKHISELPSQRMRELGFSQTKSHQSLVEV